MGTSNHLFKPGITLQVEYGHNDRPADMEKVMELIQEAYLRSPWFVAGEVEPLSLYVAQHEHGTMFGVFTIDGSLLRPVVSVSQFNAFDNLCRRIASEFASSSRQWSLRRSIQLNTCYESVRDELFTSAL